MDIVTGRVYENGALEWAITGTTGWELSPCLASRNSLDDGS